MIQFVIERHYRRGEYISQLEVAERARSLCRRLRWPVPSYRTVARRIVAESGELMDKDVIGAKRAREKWHPVPGQLFVGEPLELCQIDHTLVDVMIVSPDRKRVMGRPWLTVAMDIATRCVLGIYLTMDAPSVVSVAMCLSHAMLPKTDENRERNGRWPMYGKVRRVLTDNGKDFRSHALEQGCAEHGIALEFRPPGQPRYGGHIERIMGTLMRLVHGLPGTTFSDVHQRGDYKAEKRAAMTLAELREWLVVRICQYYHVRRHRALGIAPLVAWDRAWTLPSGELTTPPVWADPERVRLDFLPVTQRLIRRDGITYNHTRYWHPAMTGCVGREHVALVRFHPHFSGCIWFRDEDGVMVKAPAVAGRGLGQMHAPHTAQEALKLEAVLDEGLALSDGIELNARAETRKQPRSTAQCRPVPGRGARKRKPLPTPSPSVSDDEPFVVPNRASVRTEEL
ncbi:Mu transposase C-terminal domain-containing protein [Luteibacter sp. 621]|uniref:Mu transposase C-terminal domain-containing protein n=1 Tax=Luteibacter sp. 621 TaxID=3373916 RepID=UPI003D1D2424